jgi:hypothetical protein
MLRSIAAVAALTALVGCADSVTTTYGVGSDYTSKCSAKMALVTEAGTEYRADCAPPTCAEGFIDAGVSHVVVAVDPGKKVVGYAERACILDFTKIGLVTPEPGVEIGTDDDEPAE